MKEKPSIQRRAGGDYGEQWLNGPDTTVVAVSGDSVVVAWQSTIGYRYATAARFTTRETSLCFVDNAMPANTRNQTRGG